MKELIFSPKTFALDHIVRNEKGLPIGRIVLYDDNSYIPGEDVRVALLKVPLQFKNSIKGLQFYVDEYLYEVPEDINDIRVNTRDQDLVASSFILKRSIL